MRLRGALVAVVAGALGLGGCAASSAAVPTRQQVFAPASTTTLPASRATAATMSGSCWEGSLALYQDANAWRCSAANEILDPCFAPPGQSNVQQLLCASAPWAPETQLTLSAPLPLSAANSPGTGPAPVWALELANGDRCVIGTGTVQQVGSVTLDYVCSSGGFAGGLDRGHEPWTVKYRPPTSSTLRSLAVRTAWD